jgi:hypothetical protein
MGDAMKATLCLIVLVLAAGICAAASAPAATDPGAELAALPAADKPLPDPKQVGGEDGSVVEVANLIYAGVKTSKCFSDHFLLRADRESAISTSRRFHSVKVSSEDIFQYPFVIMTGEGTFTMTRQERENLRKYCEQGGFLLASAGCSSQEWDRSFRREMTAIFAEARLTVVPGDHPVFHTVYDIKSITTTHGSSHLLEGITINGKLAVLYSQDGLNDTAHTSGCCCCGGNEIANAEQINLNVLAYALSF